MDQTVQDGIYEFIGQCVVSIGIGVLTIVGFSKLGNRKEKQLKEVE